MATASDINRIETGKHFVNVFVTSNFNSFMSERRFDRGMTVGELKVRNCKIKIILNSINTYFQSAKAGIIDRRLYAHYDN